MQSQWNAVDEYFCEMFIPADPVLDAALERADAAGMPAHNVAPNQGKLLQLLAQMQGAQRILEIGTLGGYSTIWLARALPASGKVITLEANPMHAQIARENLAHAGLEALVEVRVGAALEHLPQLAVDGQPFDLIFIDADKPNNPHYLEWALKLSRPGTVIIADNVVRDGKVVDADSNDPNVVGIRRFNEMLAAEKRLSVTALQTVGSKGYDGFALILVQS